MSTFAVFGMTRSRAVEEARKVTLTVERRDGVLVHLTEEEWLAKCERAADETMASPRVTRLSDKFDAPVYAERFIEVAKQQPSRHLHIKAHCWNGEYDSKTKKKKYEWVDLDSPRYGHIKAKVGFGECESQGSA